MKITSSTSSTSIIGVMFIAALRARQLALDDAVRAVVFVQGHVHLLGGCSSRLMECWTPMRAVRTHGGCGGRGDF